jgi:LacI family transcriptional regulator
MDVENAIRGENPQNAIDRFIGYKKALEKNGIVYDSKLVYCCKMSLLKKGASLLTNNMIM